MLVHMPMRSSPALPLLTLTIAPLGPPRAVDPYIGTGIDWRLNDIVPTWTAAGGGAAAVVEAVAPVAAVAEAVASP